MLLRVLLICWSMTLALPGTALACHDTVSVVSAHTAHHAPTAPRDAVANHDLCLGCIPPTAWQTTGVAAPLIAKALPRLIVLARIDRVLPTPPALPPPRRG